MQWLNKHTLKAPSIPSLVLILTSSVSLGNFPRVYHAGPQNCRPVTLLPVYSSCSKRHRRKMLWHCGDSRAQVRGRQLACCSYYSYLVPSPSQAAYVTIKGGKGPSFPEQKTFFFFKENVQWLIASEKGNACWKMSDIKMEK